MRKPGNAQVGLLDFLCSSVKPPADKGGKLVMVLPGRYLCQAGNEHRHIRYGCIQQSRQCGAQQRPHGQSYVGGSEQCCLRLRLACGSGAVFGKRFIVVVAHVVYERRAATVIGHHGIGNSTRDAVMPQPYRLQWVYFQEL